MRDSLNTAMQNLIPTYRNIVKLLMETRRGLPEDGVSLPRDK